MPAYHAGSRICNTVQRIPAGIANTMIVVDDASRDDTFALACTLPVRAYRNERNLGYGGNMKVCLTKGLETDGDLFIELHADGQYDPAVIPEALRALKPTDGVVLGSRFIESRKALDSGMPLVKFIANRALSALANWALGTHLSEFHSGFRVYTRHFLEQANFRANSDDHLFSFETLLQALFNGFTISEVPVTCRYEPGVTHVKFKKSTKYSFEMLWAIVRYYRARSGKPDPVFSAPTPLPHTVAEKHPLPTVVARH